MRTQKWYSPFKILSHVVLLLMAIAMLYAATIAVLYWTGISV